MYLMRRFKPLLDDCAQLRTVKEAYLSYSSSTYTYSVGFVKKVRTRKCRNVAGQLPVVTKTVFADVSVDAKSLKRAVDVFTNALLHSHVTDEVRLENVELGRYFVEQMKAITNRYIIEGSSLVVRGVSLKLNVNLTDFITAVCAQRELSTSAAGWCNFVGLDDNTLKHFAANGITILCQGDFEDFTSLGLPWWNCRQVSEDALIDFAFNDCYGKAGYRSLRGSHCQLSPMFLRKLVQARRGSIGTYVVFLQANTGIRLRVEQNLDGLRQFRLHDNDDEDLWHFEFPDIPNFRIQYADSDNRICCWSSPADEGLD